MDFAGKVAFVTGAASGVGRSTALAFAAAGARVAMVDRDADGCAQTLLLVRQAGGHGLVLPCDVTQSAQVGTAVNKTVATWGQLDCAVNSAGVEGATRELLEEDDALYARHRGR